MATYGTFNGRKKQKKDVYFLFVHYSNEKDSTTIDSYFNLFDYNWG